MNGKNLTGQYVLLLYLPDNERLTIGKLGTFHFPAGWYAYVGSAMGPGGLAARVGRHHRIRKKKHWHIDYLLANRQARVERVVLASPDSEDECSVNQATGIGATAAVPGFGASDCRHRCPAHLWLIRHGTIR